MNKILTKFMMVGILGFGVINTAGAAVCFDKGLSCTAVAPSGQYDVDFEVICGSANQGSVSIRGSSVCSDQVSGHAWNTFYSGSGEKKYCWCKVIKPVVSTWYLAYTGANSLDCASSCTSKCGALVKSSAFWTNAYGDGFRM